MKRALLVALFLATPLSADEVFLRGGGRVKGIIVERSDSTIVVDVGAGRVGIPRARIERILEGRTPLSTYLERASRLAAGDVQGWLALGLWAQDQDLQTQARAAFERVVDLDPGNATAQKALGRVLLAEAWVTAEESYRARGYVPFEGSWITPGERESILAQRAEEARAERGKAEADARVREAEARARAAEAEAQRAEAAAASDGGIPIGWGAWGPWGTTWGWPTHGSGPRRPFARPPCLSCAPPAPAPQPTPAPEPRPAPRARTAVKALNPRH